MADETYMVLDAKNVVVNTIVYDGESPYNPGEGLTVVGPLAEGEQAAIGWTYNKDTDTFTPPDPME